MLWITRLTNCRSILELTQTLRNASYYSPKSFTSCSALKHFKTFAFSPPRLSKETLQNFKSFPFSRSSSFSSARAQSIFLHTQPGQRNYNGVFRFTIIGQSYPRLIQFFHTQRTYSTRSSSGIKGSPKQNQSALIYIVAVFILMLGGAYAGVPLYKVFCQSAGLGGQAVSKGHDTEKIQSMKKVERQIKVFFNADVASSMRWNFKPQQNEVTVLPGETALAFYTAKNPTDKPIIGISTYNVLPFDAGQYFNKIQCFCFEEQRLNPKEQVDMPVFFYIDPEFAKDPKLEHVDTITLSYTFFEAVDGLTLPLPGYPQPHDPLPIAATS